MNLQKKKRTSMKEFFGNLSMDYGTKKSGSNSGLGTISSVSPSVATSGFHSMTSMNMNVEVEVDEDLNSPTSPHPNGSEHDLTIRNSGFSLFLQQFRAMLRKKVLVTCRSWSLTLLQVEFFYSDKNFKLAGFFNSTKFVFFCFL